MHRHNFRREIETSCSGPTLTDARRNRFEIVIVAAFDRLARNVRHFLEVLDEFNHLGITFISLRENIDTAGPLGRAMVVIVGAIAELQRSLIPQPEADSISN
ncbi:MAG: recombinase family protein [Candidatus Acidiferrales bacterium]